MDNCDFSPHHPTPSNVIIPACVGLETCLVQSWLWNQVECSLLMAGIHDSSAAGKVWGN